MFQASGVEKIKTHILCSGTFFFFENRVLDEIMWKNIVKRYKPRMTIWRMLIACWITYATRTHSQYVILSVFPLKQCLHEFTSVLRKLRVVFRLTYILSGDWRVNILRIRKPTRCHFFVFFISLLIVAQHVSGNNVPIIRS
jgi:hypothetical protein